MSDNEVVMLKNVLRQANALIRAQAAELRKAKAGQDYQRHVHNATQEYGKAITAYHEWSHQQ